jgi:hypothetical protein
MEGIMVEVVVEEVGMVGELILDQSVVSKKISKLDVVEVRLCTMKEFKEAISPNLRVTIHIYIYNMEDHAGYN